MYLGNIKRNTSINSPLISRNENAILLSREALFKERRIYMSKRFKELRESTGISKSTLAEKLYVDYRTITNWEKENGILPSLDSASDIAKALGVSTYDVYESFIFDDNEIMQHKIKELMCNDRFSWLDDLTKDYISPKDFFKYLFYARNEFGAGIVQHNYHVFSFIIAYPIIRKYDGNMSEYDNLINDCRLQQIELLDLLQKSLYSTCGFFVSDKKMNYIVFSEENLECCRLISKNCGNLTFELVLNSPVFPSMEDEIRLSNKSSVYLTLFDYRRSGKIPSNLIQNWLSGFQFDFDKDNIIGKFIKSVRNSFGLNQTEFANRIVGTVISVKENNICYEFSNKTINKWETGIVKPSLLQLFRLGESYDFSVRKLLDQFDAGFFVGNAVNNSEMVYDIGLNYWFNRSDNIACWKNFISTFKLIKSFTEDLIDNSAILGEVNTGKEELEFEDIVFSEYKIIVKFTNNSKTIIPIEDIKCISNKNNLSNLLYETEISYGKETIHKIRISVSFFAHSKSQ